MTEPDKPEQSPSAPPPPPPPPPPNPGEQQPYPQQQSYPQQPYPQQQPYAQQQYPQQQYPQQQYGYGAAPGGYPPPQGAYGSPPAQAPKNGFGIASLVVAIVSLLSVFGGVLLGIVAIVLGVIGRGRAKRGEATNGGVAMAGIALGLLSVLVSIIAIVLTVQFAQDVGAGDLYDCLQQAGSDSAAQQDCQQRFQQNIEDQFGVSLTPSP